MVRLACPDAEGFPLAQVDGKAMTSSSADSSAVERNPRRKGDDRLILLMVELSYFLFSFFY